MCLLRDWRVLIRLLAAPIRGTSHAERLESFYSAQAENYDSFRARLLPGRRELIECLDIPPGGVWVDLGAGTGANLELFGSRLSGFSAVYLVDLAPSLLAMARRRTAAQGWTNVHTVLADAAEWTPPVPKVDLVTFSYSLSMIPDWFRAVANVERWLAPRGTVGAVDFYVGRKHPAPSATRHGWLTRTVWPIWFSFDNVMLSPDHLPFLQEHFGTVQLTEGRARLPYLPFVRAPYYVFVGRKLA
jgi:S-adenosylmethionine-diacylgycerolhomoserine-N-methlytransferase